MTWNNQTLRDLERASIRAFVESCSEHLTGDVLDLGCGQKPYADIVKSAGGTYFPWDRADLPGNVSGEDVGAHDRLMDGWNAVLCTQVAQYVPYPGDWLSDIRQALKGRRGRLVMTTGLTWPEVEPTDLWRFTRAGLQRLFTEAGFTVERLESRAALPFDGFELSLGYGVVASA